MKQVPNNDEVLMLVKGKLEDNKILKNIMQVIMASDNHSLDNTL